MRLLNSVKRFAFDDITDPYGIGSTIKGRFSVFDDEKSSGVSTRRRILETPPSYTMYSTYCVAHNGSIYVVGAPSYDRHRGEVIRIKYPVIPCDKAYKIATVRQILTNTVTVVPTYAYLDHSRNTVADSETSFPVPIFSAIMSDYEDIGKGHVIFSGNEYYRARSQGLVDGAGFKTAEVSLVENAVQTMSFVQSAGYDPVTEQVVAGTTYADTTVFVESAYYNYVHTSGRFTKIVAGDKIITAVLAVTPKPGDSFGSYRVVAVETIDTNTHSCQCRL